MMDKNTQIIASGPSCHYYEIINDQETAHWFAGDFKFEFTNPIKKIKIYYKSINLEKRIFINELELTNLPEKGAFEVAFNVCADVVHCRCNTFVPAKLGPSADYRNLGLFISKISYLDIYDKEYLLKISEIPVVTKEISDLFNHQKNTSNNIYYHCGDFGDIIYSLPVIKATGGGTLYLGNQMLLDNGRCGIREGISEKKFVFLKNLLEFQPYIKEVLFTDSYPKNVTHDLNKFRKMFIDRSIANEYNDAPRYDDFPNGANITLLDAPLKAFNLDLSIKDNVWLRAKNDKIINKKIVINRTERVRNVYGESDQAYRYIVGKFKSDSVFVGTDSEYSDFIKRYGYVDRYIVNSADEMAQLIDQCYIFIGNSSFAFAISESLKKNSYFEIKDDYFKHTKFFREGHHKLNMLTASKIKIPTIYHIVSLYEPKDAETKNRMDIAYKSWQKVYETNKNIIPIYVYEKDYPRNSSSLGDNRKCAFLKDLLRMGYEKCQSDDDIVMITNDDTILSPFIGSKIYDKIIKYQACKSFRLNVKNFESYTDLKIHNVLGRDGGRDMFAMTKRWIRRNIALIPDYVLGSTDWDFYLALLIQFTNGIWIDLKKNDALCETDIDFGHVLHIYHSSPWKKMIKINDYNTQLTKQYINKLGFSEEFKSLNYDKYKTTY